MAQRSDLPSFYGERTKDGAIVQRPAADDEAELIRVPPKSVHRRTASQNSLVPFQEPPRDSSGEPILRRQTKDRFDELTAEGEHRRNTRNGPGGRDTQRDSDFDWDREARRRLRNERRRSDDYYPRTRDIPTRRDYYDRDPYSGYDDYYNDQRRLFNERRDERISRRETMGPPPRRRPRSAGYSDEYDTYDENGKKRSESLEVPMRIPLTMWMNSTLKNRKSAFPTKGNTADELETLLRPSESLLELQCSCSLLLLVRKSPTSTHQKQRVPVLPEAPQASTQKSCSTFPLFLALVSW